MSAASLIHAFSHLGVRVRELARSLAFYGKLGFDYVEGFEGDPVVVVVRHPAGIELNLIVNASPGSSHNVLQDAEVKHPGYTHFALQVGDLDAFVGMLDAAGIAISEGPVTLPNGLRACFVRDPDGNVIELNQPTGRPA